MPTPDVELRILDRLGGLGERWDRLAAAQELASPFLRSWWIDHVAGGPTVVLCCFAEGELVGGAAFELDRPGLGPVSVERVRCVGQGVLAPDHLDLIATPAHRPAVLEAVTGWLRRGGSRIVDLDGLAATGSLAAAFAADEIERTGAPFAILPADPDDYVSARPGRVRSTIKRTAKRLAAQDVVHRRVAVDEAARALDELARLHEGRWAEQSSFLAAWERFRVAALAGIEAGEVRIHEMVTAEGQVVATELDIVVGDRVGFYQAGRRTEREWRGAGSVLRTRIVREAIDEGRREYDLLRGDEPYKADWAGERRELVRCRTGVGPLGRAVLAAAALWAGMGRGRAWLAPRLARLSRAASRSGPAPRPGRPG